MSLTVGTKLGRYEILSPLGAGGMGEVYLARDTKLDRFAALKILPSDVALNEERMRRFTQEAKAAAALNHPNIAHIYEIGEIDETHFIAMEYIDGITLREEIYHKKTSFRTLSKYLIQVAEGLAKAHAAGIVHRDLKPDNIMISRDGYAKILDFGLAKLIQPQEAKNSQEIDSGETATAILEQHSTPGMIMGTVGYMSPEQAQGKVREIDHRSDIFSFGCILYEAIARQRAFEGKDQIDTLHKIVHAPTPLIKDINPDSPADLQRIVRRCLAKESDKRFQSIKDVALELDELRQELRENAISHDSLDSRSKIVESETNSQQTINTNQNSATLARETESIHPTSSAEYVVSGIKSHKKSVAIVSLIFLIILGGIGFALYIFRGQAGKTSPSIKIEKLTTNGKSRDAAISPDGKYVVYTVDEGGQFSLWTRQIATSSNVQIISPTDAWFWALSFSPDGNYINLVKKEKIGLPVLYQLPVLGGAQKKLLPDMDGAVSFSPDGKQFTFVRGNNPNLGESSLMIANADGTGERILAKRDRKTSGTFPWWSQPTPAWSPDGKTIAVITGGANTGSGLMNVVEIDVASGAEKTITPQGWYEIKRIAWLKDKSGFLVLGADKASAFYSQQIWHISYPDGEARRITTDFNDYIGMSLAADSEMLAAVQSNRISNIWVAPNGDANRAVQIKSGGNNQEGTDGLAWTQDGKIVYYSKASGGDDIWIMNGDGTGHKQLTIDSGVNYDLKVTPDNRHIVFVSEREGKQNIWRMDLEGGNPKQLTNFNSAINPGASPDSRWIFYGSDHSGKPAIWKVSIDGGESVQLTEEYAAENPELSPDGKLIACQYRENINSDWRYAIIPSEGGKPLKIFDLPGGTDKFRWSQDGRSLTYDYTQGGVTNIWSFPLHGSPPKQLTDFKTDQIYNFKWSADGKQLLLARGTSVSDVVLIKDFR